MDGILYSLQIANFFLFLKNYFSLFHCLQKEKEIVWFNHLKTCNTVSVFKTMVGMSNGYNGDMGFIHESAVSYMIRYGDIAHLKVSAIVGSSSKPAQNHTSRVMNVRPRGIIMTCLEAQ